VFEDFCTTTEEEQAAQAQFEEEQAKKRRGGRGGRPRAAQSPSLHLAEAPVLPPQQLPYGGYAPAAPLGYAHGQAPFPVQYQIPAHPAAVGYGLPAGGPAYVMPPAGWPPVAQPAMPMSYYPVKAEGQGMMMIKSAGGGEAAGQHYAVPAPVATGGRAAKREAEEDEAYEEGEEEEDAGAMEDDDDDEEYQPKKRRAPKKPAGSAPRSHKKGGKGYVLPRGVLKVYKLDALPSPLLEMIIDLVMDSHELRSW
jgi:hypothetical protein